MQSSAEQRFQPHNRRGVPYEILPLLPSPPTANLLPIFPKHTQLQNSTLAIHVPTPIISLLTNPSYPTLSYDIFTAAAAAPA